jgi:hypothetical protein
MNKAIREFLPVPAYVAVCANMVRYDLLHGPAFARLPADGIKAITNDDLATLYEDAEESCEEGDSVVVCLRVGCWRYAPRLAGIPTNALL